MENPGTHYFHVRIEIPLEQVSGTSGHNLRFVMPVWTPGSYLVREFSRNVLDFEARDSETGKDLPSFKTSKNIWEVNIAEARGDVSVSYKVYAFEFTVDTSYLDTRHAIINGASVFMYVEGYENKEHIVTILPNPKWMQISTSLDPLEESRYKEIKGGKSFKAPNFDILIDSPIEIGNQEVHSFRVENIEHQVSLFGPKPVQSEPLVSDLRKIVESTWKVFGEIPYRRYLFLIDFASNPIGGGLEHLSSTHCIAPRWRLTPKQEYNRRMALFSHELFHAWNVKRMRPQGLGPFDYSSETYTKSLWIAEGITSYYDDLIVRRAQIYTAAEYLDAFCLNVDHMSSLPAPQFESAEESSFDTWIRHYRPNENTPNVHSSYYFQGAVIGWMLDMEIRRNTDSIKTLDDAMRRLYTESYVKEKRGYTEGEFEKICEDMIGNNSLKEIFDSRVRGHQSVNFDRYLGYAGLTLGYKEKKENTQQQQKGYLGIKTKSDLGKIIISGKLFGSPAETSGLAAGDEVIAVDNLRVDAATFPFYVSVKGPGDKIEVLVSRDGEIESFQVELSHAPQLEHRIFKKENATDSEKRLFREWMQSDWDSPLEYIDYTQSPHTPKLFDYV